MFLSKFSSPNFSFTGIGRTKKLSRDALIAGLKKHGQQYDLEDEWYLDYYQSKDSFFDDICFIKVSFGECIRDNELIK